MAITATIAPQCVRPGTPATIDVKTDPKAGVGYEAIYAGGKTGAAPPFGNGMGGNAGGYADAKGHYSNTWVVSPQAPLGPAYVVVAAVATGRKGQIKVPFKVAATC
jgi:hypothetical protein